jgi:hypothetical protein
MFFGKNILIKIWFIISVLINQIFLKSCKIQIQRT